MAQLKLIIQVNCKLRCYIWGNVVGTYPPPPRSISQAASESLLGLEIPEAGLLLCHLYVRASGRLMQGTVKHTDGGRSVQDFPGLKTGSPVSWEVLQSQANQDSWSI